MIFVTLDLGTNMALATNAFGTPTTSSFVAAGTRPVRASQIMRWLDGQFFDIWLTGEAVDLCVYETPFNRGYDATRCSWGLAGLIEALATAYGWAVADQSPQSIKSFALAKVGSTPNRGKKKLTKAERTAKAAAEKLKMIEAAKLMGYTGTNEHEADTYCLLMYIIEHAVKTIPAPKRTTKRKKP